MTSNLLSIDFPSGKRNEPRIDFPAYVSLCGQEVKTLDWSVSGFSIPDKTVKESDFTDRQVSLYFPLHQGSLKLEVTCEVVRRSADGYALGFKFVELDPVKEDTLKRIINSFLHSEEITLDEAIKQGVKGRLLSDEKARLAASWGKFAALGLAVFAVFSLAAFLLYKKAFVVSSQYAAVVENIIEVQSNSYGKLSFDGLTVGDKVKDGQPLFKIVSADQQDKLRDKSTALAVLNLDIKRDNEKYNNINEFLKSYTERLDVKEASLAKIIDAIKKEIDVQQNQYDLLSTKFNNGIVDAVAKNKNELLLYEKKTELLQNEEQARLQRNYAQLAAKGVFSRSEISNVNTLNELRQDLSYKKNYRAVLEKEISDLKSSLVYRSPCDCEVRELNAYQGAISTNKMILKLVPTKNKEKFILALVPLDDAKNIFDGDTADFMLASSPKVHEGTVAKISYFSSENSNIYTNKGELLSGLPKNLPKVTQYALVKIKPDEHLAEASFNEPATVNINLGVWKSLKRGFFL
ncbi:PilZ domain-containing protein [Gallaecimonas mangrovi]|uniref:PilZ domain-containing protein n=1 Tax=Gallaecimonas mangrovi TaxID=2291597 RepID=UPI0018666E0D|nr:PilZ domain-containing protein [Gallaecimonas mangrovi]